MSWRTEGSIRYYIPNIEHKALAFFDLDHTLITSKSGRKYILDENDWIYLGDINMLKSGLVDMIAEYSIVIVTNQIKFNINTQNIIESVRESMESIFGISPSVLISTKNDNNRKPDIGMANFIMDKTDAPNIEFMCGDAIGDSSDYPPYKWSDSDLRFAENLNVEFIEPRLVFPSNEEYVLEYIKNYNIIIMMGNPVS